MFSKIFVTAFILLCAPVVAQQQFTPNDPEFSNQEALRLMRVPEAWEITTGDSTVIIGILDSGIDYNHPDLAPNIYRNPGEWGTNGALSMNGIDDDGNGYIDDWRGWDFVGSGSSISPLPDNDPMDFQGRGTGIAGCASAKTDNGIGIASPGFRTKLLPVKVTPDTSTSLVSTSEAIRYAADMGCKIIMCSWNLNTEIDRELKEAVNYAANKGALVISNMAWVIDGDDIGGVPPNDVVYWDEFDWRVLYVMGKSDPGNGHVVDIDLQSTSVITTGLGGTYTPANSNNYAAGLVAGIAALVAAQHPTWTGDQIATQLKAATQSPDDENKQIDAFLAVSDSTFPGPRLKHIGITYPNGHYLERIGQTATVQLRVENALLEPASNLEIVVYWADNDLYGSKTFRIGTLNGGQSTVIAFDITLDESLEITSPYLRLLVEMRNDRVQISELRFVKLQLDDEWLGSLIGKPGYMYQFTGLDAVDKNVIWMFGYPLGPNIGRPHGKTQAFLSTDGGNHWDIINGNGFPSRHIVTAIAGINGQAGLVAAGTETSTYVYRTSDRGATWDSTDVGVWAQWVSVLHMFDANEGLLIGEREDDLIGICKTYDGGKTWAPIQQKVRRRNTIIFERAADFIGNSGWVGSFDGLILATKDRGTTWDSLKGPEQVIRAITLFDTTTFAVACANYQNIGDGYSYLTTDGGTTWSQMHPYLRAPIGCLFMAEPNGKRFWFSSDNYLRASSDSGKTSYSEQRPFTVSGGAGFLCWDVIREGDSTYAWIGGPEVLKRKVLHSSIPPGPVNDPEFKYQSALTNMHLPEAWEITTGDSTVIIGILDSGIDYNHPDLAPNIYRNPGEWGTNGELSSNGKDDDGNGYVDDWRGWDFVGSGSSASPLPDNNPMDYLGRGTGIAGCASARTDNGIGIASPGFRTKLLPVKVTPDSSTSLVSTSEAIRYAADMGCKIITCSWYLTTEIDTRLYDAVNYAADKGALVVTNMPAMYDEDDLGGTPPWDMVYWDALVQRALYVMEEGEAAYGYGASIDLKIPNGRIVTTKLGGGYIEVDSSKYSIAYVSGIAALVAARHPDWTGDQIATRLKAAATYPFHESKTVDAYLAVSDTARSGMRIKNVEIEYPNGEFLAHVGERAHVRLVIENCLPDPAKNLAVELTPNLRYSIEEKNHDIGELAYGDSAVIEFDVVIPSNPDFTSPFIEVFVSMLDDKVWVKECFFVRLQLEGEWLPCFLPRQGDGYGFPGLDAVNKDVVWTYGVPIRAWGGATFKNRAFVTTDGGAVWHLAVGTGYPTQYNVTAISAIDENNALVSAKTDKSLYVFRTTDRGNSWDSCDVGTITDRVSVLHMFDESEGLLIGENGDFSVAIAKTFDGGISWSPVNHPFIKSTIKMYYRGSDFIGDIGWFTTYDSLIYTTTDRGNTWDSLPSPEIASQKISFFSPTSAIVSCANSLGMGSNFSYITTDAGNSWTRMHEYIKPFPGSLFLAEPYGSKIWYSNSNYLSASHDSGKTTIGESKPLTTRFSSICASYDIVSEGDSVYIWVAGAEIYKRTLLHSGITDTTVSVPNVPLASELQIEVFPNPSASFIGVTYGIPSETYVKLAVYDNLGREVKVLANGWKAAGTYTVTFNAAELPSGMYLYRIETGKGSVAKKMVLMK